jgi:hypothetical protein
MDIGILEIEQPYGRELVKSQLGCDDDISGANMHIVGHPIALIEDKGKEFLIKKTCFGSSLIDQTDEYMRFGKALDTLGDALECDQLPVRIKAAIAVLQLAQVPPASTGIGAINPEEIVRREVEGRRSQARSIYADLLDDGKGLQPFDTMMNETWLELERLAIDPEPESRLGEVQE